MVTGTKKKDPYMVHIMGPLNLPFKPYEFKDKSPHSLAADRVGAFGKVGFSGDLSIKSAYPIVRPDGTP
jgi:hypothetical protein